MCNILFIFVLINLNRNVKGICTRIEHRCVNYNTIYVYSYISVFYSTNVNIFSAIKTLQFVIILPILSTIF